MNNSKAQAPRAPAPITPRRARRHGRRGTGRLGGARGTAQGAAPRAPGRAARAKQPELHRGGVEVLPAGVRAKELVAEELHRGGVVALSADPTAPLLADAGRAGAPVLRDLVENTAADLLIPRRRHAREEDAVDRAVLRWIARFRFVTANLLAQYLGVAHQTALARVRLLVDHGYLDRQPGPPGEALALSVNARGMRAINLPPRRSPRSDVQREHELALVWLVLQLEARRSGVVYTERECRRAERDHPDQRMSADVIDTAGRSARRWPDLVLRRAPGDLIVLELERTLKDPTRLSRIVAGYSAAAWFSEVRLYCTDRAVARGLVAAVARAEVPWRETPAITVAPWPGLRPEAKTALRAAIADA